MDGRFLSTDSVFGKSHFKFNKKDLEAINAVFLTNPKIESVKIFGSRAKGNYRKNSDIDLVLMDNNVYMLVKNQFNN